MAGFPTALESGLAGHYRLERELGRGGMARVYLAHDLRHDRPVALKVLNPGLGAVLGAERFLREVRTAARLQHPNILPVFDSGAAAPGDDELLWYTMPYVEGESLRDRLTRERQLAVDEAVAIAREVAEALDYAHGRNVIHRDIKPENIMLSRGHALVADFGIALALREAQEPQHAERLTQVGLALGTPSYMSPEQASGADALDGRSDVYSLGCVLFEMLAGDPPFTGPTVQAVIAKRFTDPVPAPSRGGRSIPAELDRIVHAGAGPGAGRSVSDGGRARGGAARRRAVERADREPAAGGRGRRRGVDRGAALRQPEPVAGERVLRRRDDRRADQRARQGAGAPRRVPDLVFRVQGPAGGRPRDRPPAPGAHRAGGERAPGRASPPGVDPAHQRRRRLPALVGELRPGGGGHLRDPGRDRAGDRRRASAAAARIRSASRRSSPPTEDLEAYGLYLKGRHFWNRRTEQDLRLGMRYFEQALARDPGFALAHAGMADTWALLGFYSAMPPGEAFPNAKRAAHEALARQPGLVEAYPALAYAAMYYDWDWPEAERAFRRAIELHPGYANAHQWYANFLSIMGRCGGVHRRVRAGAGAGPAVGAQARRAGLGLLLRAAVRARCGGVPAGRSSWSRATWWRTLAGDGAGGDGADGGGGVRGGGDGEAVESGDVEPGVPGPRVCGGRRGWRRRGGCWGRCCSSRRRGMRHRTTSL